MPKQGALGARVRGLFETPPFRKARASSFCLQARHVVLKDGSSFQNAGIKHSWCSQRERGLARSIFVISLSLSLALSFCRSLCLCACLSVSVCLCLSLSVTPNGPTVISEIFKPRPLITWLEKQDWFHRVPHQTPRLPKNLVNTLMSSSHASYE